MTGDEAEQVGKIQTTGCLRASGRLGQAGIEREGEVGTAKALEPGRASWATMPLKRLGHYHKSKTERLNRFKQRVIWSDLHEKSKAKQNKTKNNTTGSGCSPWSGSRQAPGLPCPAGRERGGWGYRRTPKRQQGDWTQDGGCEDREDRGDCGGIQQCGPPGLHSGCLEGG